MDTGYVLASTVEDRRATANGVWDQPQAGEGPTAQGRFATLQCYERETALSQR